MTISFEHVPYDGRPIDGSRPEYLAVAAWLSGVRATHPGRARVLELGCAEGANLIPHAYHCPEASFVGIDSSPRHIEIASERRDRLGLDNLTFVCCDIAELDAHEELAGPWDYILSHGVLSWVSDDVAEHMFQILGERLAENGVAYLSYNTQPGWMMRGLIRQVLMARTRGIEEAGAKLTEARNLLSLIAKTPFTSHHYSAYMAEEASDLLEHEDAYIAHEYLTEHNRAYTYGEIIARCERHGLKFLAELTPIAHGGLEERLRAVVGRITEDPIEREELADVLYGRAFRASVFVRADVQTIPDDEAKARLVDAAGFVTHITPVSKRPSLDPEDSEEFVDREGVHIGAKHPVLKAALIELARAFPLALSFEHIVDRTFSLLSLRRVRTIEQPLTAEERESLLEDLLRLVGLRHAELRLIPRGTVATSGDRPRVTTLARFESRTGKWFTNAFHQAVELDEAAAFLVNLMDGSHTRDELAGQLAATLEEHGVAVQDESGEQLEGNARLDAMRRFVDRQNPPPRSPWRDGALTVRRRTTLLGFRARAVRAPVERTLRGRSKMTVPRRPRPWRCTARPGSRPSSSPVDGSSARGPSSSR